MCKKIVLSLFVVLFSIVQIQAQKAKITGKVLSSKTGEALIGATITLDGTKKTVKSDQNGFYSISGLEKGSYQISATYVSYSKKTIPGIDVKENEVVNQDIVMEKAGDMSAVVVKSSGGLSKPKETVNSLLIAQKNSSSVSDGISAEAIKKTPDRNTSDILKRVSGASIQDDKFVIVRGLNDRYNAAFLNGAPLPSTEGDRKAFSFDIFPANMLDNLIIIKTATPDLPAEFAGGIIQINSKDIVQKNFQSVTFGAGFNTITTFKNFSTYFGGGLDFVGIDDKTRALPSFIPNTEYFPQPASTQPYLAKRWYNEWATHNIQAFTNLNFQYVNGRNFQRKGKDFFGSLFSVTYSRNYTTSNGLNREHQEASLNDTSGIKTEFSQTNNAINVLVGLLGNFSLKINDRNSISFKNIYSINSEDKVLTRVGYGDLSESDPLFSIGKSLWFTSNKILSSQLIGDHYLAASKIKINWMAGISDVRREIPDLRTTIYSKLNSETDLRASVSDNATTNGNGGGIYYGNLKENSKIFKVDLQRSFKFGENVTSNFKIGAYIQERDRAYNQRNLGMVKGTVGNTFFDYRLLYLPEGEIFKHIGPGAFILAEDKNPSNNYTAKTNLTAAYAMADQRFGKFLRLIYGARVEKFNLKLFLPVGQGFADTVNRTVTDVLPSGSAIFSIDKKQNLRFAYYKTLNRPEFRELAPAKFFDFATRYVTNGDTSIKRAVINNFDVRYEIYPGRGQVFTFTAFYKKFTDPIEQATAPDKDHEAAYFNVLGAVNKGVEFDGRILIGDLIKSKLLGNIFEHLTVFTNVSFIKSNVTAKKAGDTTTINLDRPLQGQSPYCFNAGLTYQNDDKGFSATIAANRVGQRIYLVGNVKESDIWENGRTVLDLQVAKTFSKKNLELKLNIKDILAQKSIFFEDTNGDKKYKKGEDYVRWYKTFGSVISLSLTHKF